MIKQIDSINLSKRVLKEIYQIDNIVYKCNSWLLSNELNRIIDQDSNIHKFYNLFVVEDGEDCISDILNFVYEMEKCDNYSLLPENTKLQKKIKEQLLNGKEFYLGIGILKEK